MVNETSLMNLDDSKSNENFLLTYLSYLRWSSHSYEMLHDAETKIFSKIKAPFKRFYVKLGKCVGDDDKIWTVAMNTESKNTPIVLLHGFGAGSAFWAMNLEELSQDHPVYALDTLGFARSSRPEFAEDPKEIEQQFVDFIERWREVMGIEKMVLCGHSFGGYQSSSYAMKYPERLEHLILADPWGYDEAPDPSKFPLWKLSVALTLRLIVGPFVMVRAFGPFGEWLIKSFRPDLLNKYNSIVEPSTFSQYIYHCNSNSNFSGEAAFHRMAFVGPCSWSPLGHVWPIHPIGERMKNGLSDDIPVTYIYGNDTWIHKGYGGIIRDNRPNSYTNVIMIDNAGHHMYTDNASEFNQTVLEACKILKSDTKK